MKTLWPTCALPGTPERPPSEETESHPGPASLVKVSKSPASGSVAARLAANGKSSVAGSEMAGDAKVGGWLLLRTVMVTDFDAERSG